MLSTVLALPLFLAAASALPAVTQRDGACPAVHIILARGNDEPYPGRQGDMVTAICNKISNCDYEDIIYDKPKDDWCTTVMGGYTNGTAQIKAFNQRCPESKIVLSGYSQGGQVVGDILGGGGGTFYDGCVQKTNPPLDRNSSPGNKIVAALLWGDIRHNKDQSFNTGDGSNLDGAFPRSSDQVTSLNKWGDILRSYCDSVDPICAKGNNGKDHEEYFDHYDSDASDWVSNIVSGGSSQSASSSAVPEQAQAASATQAPAAASNSAAPSTSITLAAEVSSTLLAPVMASPTAAAASAAIPSEGSKTAPTTVSTVAVKPAATSSVPPIAGKATGAAASIKYPTTLMTLTAIALACVLSL